MNSQNPFNNNLTNISYWDKFYESRTDISVIETHGFRNRPNRIIANLIEKLGLENKKILEIGAGDSAWLSYFARKYPNSYFVGMDYSEEGCKRLSKRLVLENISNVDVCCKDMFSDEKELNNFFDVVLSFGLVEHFSDLSYVLNAKKKFVKKNGYLFTIIPNMAGLIGFLTKKWDPEIYAAHNPHDWVSFARGHQQAGLNIVEGGYLLSSNFGVLSSIFNKNNSSQPKIRYMYYLYLTRLSKLGYLFEDLFFTLPTTKFLSPYIYAISQPE